MTYLESPTEITQLKAEIAEYISKGKSKTYAVNELAGKYFTSEAKIWKCLREVKS